MVSYLTWDVECGIKTYNKRKASPFHPDNYVVVSAWKRKGMARAVADYFTAPPEGDWFRKLLDGTKILVGFNIKFDLLHALRDPDNYGAWKLWVAGGGKVWDVQLAEYLLHGMAREHHMLSLDEVAPRYGGHLKNDAVKSLWEAGIDTKDIDKDMLIEYAIGLPGDAKDLGDIGNTELAFLGQVEALRARGAITSVMLNMDSLLCTIEMERNGMYVDKQRGVELAEQLSLRLVALREELAHTLPADLPFEFKWSSRFHLSALVFGGDIKYKAKAPILDDNGNLTYVQKDETHYVLVDGTTMECSKFDAIMDRGGFYESDVPHELGHTSEDGRHWVPLTSRVTFAGGKNKGEAKTKKVKVPDLEKGPKQRYEDFIYTFKGYTEPAKMWESSTPGVYSVASDVIAALGNRDIPFLKSLAEMAGLNKDLGTYYIVTDEDTGEQSGMLTLVGSDSIIHHSLNHTSTVTGRFSSSNPNLQNVPKEGKSDVKTVFVSRFTQGKIIQSDFTALEIYMQGLLTEDKQLLLDLLNGLDMHCARVAQTYKVDYDFVVLASKDDTHPEHALWKKRRTNAKVFSFQRAYGAGAAKIALTTGMDIEEVEKLIAAEQERYPLVEEFYAKVTEAIKANRIPTGRFVQHPDIPGLTCQLGRSHYITPDKKMYAYSEQPSPKYIAEKPASRGGVAQSFSPTEIKNYIVQGTGGEWAKAAMALCIRAYYQHDNFGGRALLVNQVHDALYADAAPEVEIQAAALLHACMEEASAYMEYTFKWKVAVPVPTETKSGANMMEEHNLPEGFKLQVKAYRKLIRDTFMPGFVPSSEQGE